MAPAQLQPGLQIRRRRRRKIIQYSKSLLNLVSQEKNRLLLHLMFVPARLGRKVDADVDVLVVIADVGAPLLHQYRRKNRLFGLVDVDAVRAPRRGEDAPG